MPRGVYDRNKSEGRASVGALQDIGAQEGRSDPIPQDMEALEEALRTEAINNALPNPPKRAGWHYFWGSTTNTYVPIQYYLRLGYMPVKPEEIPEMSHLKMHSGEYDGFIMCNEMLLMKCPEAVYQRYMQIVHHERPNEESERLKANLEAIKEEIGKDSAGRDLVEVEDDAMRELGERRPVKHFE